MTAVYDPTLVDRLVSEARSGTLRHACCECDDEVPDDRPCRYCNGQANAANCLAAMAEQLEAARALVEQLRADEAGQRARCRLEDADRDDLVRGLTVQVEQLRDDSIGYIPTAVDRVTTVGLLPLCPTCAELKAAAHREGKMGLLLCTKCMEANQPTPATRVDARSGAQDSDLLMRALFLAQEHERHDQAMTEGPWSVWTSNSFRRVTALGRRDGGVLSGCVQRHDRQPDLCGENLDADLAGVCALRDAAPEVAATLRALASEVCRLTACLPNWDLTQALQQRDALIACGVADQAKIRELTAEVRRRRAVDLSEDDVRLLRGIREDAASWQQSHGERLLLDRLIAGSTAAWRSDAPPSGVRCLVTVSTSAGLRVTCASVSPDHEGTVWFSEGCRQWNVVAWMPAPEPAREQVAP